MESALERHPFTERARLAILFARRAARQRAAAHVGAEHLLWGLVREEEGTGAEILANHGVNRDAVETILGPPGGPDPGSEHGSPPFDEAAERVLERAAHEARWAGREYAATEHLLLGLVHETKGECARLLVESGVNEDGVREELTHRRR